MTCNKGQFWDVFSKTCKTCEIGKTFDVFTGRCVQVTTVCSFGQLYNPLTRRCECPASKPYWTDNACISCDSDSHWVASIKSCVTCTDEEIWDIVNQRCVNCPENQNFDPKTGNCVSPINNCEGGKLYNENLETCECPASAPYWNEE